MSAPALTCSDLTKDFKSLRAVDKINFGVSQGEIVGFLGPNGAGKTTTIRILMGFLRPTSGTCTILGESAFANPAVRKRIGYLPGDLRVDPTMTGNDLFNWFGSLRGETNTKRRKELIDLFALDPTHAFGTLSKGNRQKIGLVQAFEHDPDVLILDEPTSGLDPLLQQTFLRLIQEAAKRGAGVLYSSHALHEIEQASNRIAIIRAGKLVEVSTINALLDHARHRLQLRFSEAITSDALAEAPHVVECNIEGDTATVLVDGPVGDMLRVATGIGNLLRVRNVGDDLEELFLSLYEPNTSDSGDRR